jgi:NAD(P) transhydrogenase subunit beta
MGAYEIISLLLSLVLLWGIKKMSSPKTAVSGNRISAFAMLAAIVVVMSFNGILGIPLLWGGIFIGSALGYILAMSVKMIQMPQMVALLNGLGGGASALVALIEIFERFEVLSTYNRLTSQLALIVGCITLGGSLIAAAKLDRRISQRPLVLAGYSTLSNLIILSMAGLIMLGLFISEPFGITAMAVLIALIALFYGGIFALRVGGADMPITISLLNSLSGVAGAICGFTIGDPLLVAVGAIVGSSGIILTQIMCKAMNRSLVEVLRGSAAKRKVNNAGAVPKATAKAGIENEDTESLAAVEKKPIEEVLAQAQKVIIVPGYGMAIAQAQSQVKQLYEKLVDLGKEVKFAIHPVAGRMPGHMNVLLAEVDVPYDKLMEMEDVNAEFTETDLVIVVGACDVVNPAANTAEGTPIYGMPILKVDEAKHIIVCNLDTKPGYSGVENSLYDMPKVYLMLGNAADTLEALINF